MVTLGASVTFHVVHYGVMLGVPAIVLTAIAIKEDRAAKRGVAQTAGPEGVTPFVTRAPPESKEATARPFVLAALSAGAGIVHAGVTRAHFDEFWLFGVFFLASATLQILWAALLLDRPTRTILALAAIGNIAVVLLWLVSRTVGLPFGPESGSPESIGTRDLAATAFEIVLAFWCLHWIRNHRSFEGDGVEPHLVRSKPIAALIVVVSVASLFFRS